MSEITFTPKTSHNIFGERHVYQITKRCQGIPGFSPEYYDKSAGDLVVSFKNLKPFWQTFQDLPNLEQEEIFEIYEKLKTGFVKEDFNNI